MFNAVLIRKIKYYIMKFILFFLFASGPLFILGQNLHVDVFGGISTYQGDLQNKRFTLEQSNLAVGLGLSYDLSPRLSIRTGFTYGAVEGDDKKNTSVKGNDSRNLNFKSTISEVHLGLEYNFFNMEGTSITPYVFAGIAGFQFNPYTTDTAGSKFFLQPLSTEGQGLSAYPDRKEYKLTQLSIPFGGGLKLKLSETIQLGLEVGLRKLFTDYLDDVSTTYVDEATLFAAKGPKATELAFRGDEINPSRIYPPANEQRGNAKRKDLYYFSGIRLSKLLGGNSGGGSRKNNTGCPRSVF